MLPGARATLETRGIILRSFESRLPMYELEIPSVLSTFGPPGRKRSDIAFDLVKMRKGCVCGGTIHVVDLCTALGKIPGGDVPTGRPIEGLDRRAYLRGKQPRPSRSLHDLVPWQTCRSGVRRPQT